jgi:hypothetical protein
MKRLTLVAVSAIVFALAFLASAASAAPIIQQFHGTFSDVNPTDNLCGIDGSSVDYGMDNIQVLGSGFFKDESQFVYTFTSAATGKSVQISNHVQLSSTVPVDNGDGTETFVNSFKGIPEMVKLPNGGRLIADTGNASFILTAITATGQVIDATIAALDGPHPIFVSGGTADCEAIVAALS